MSEKKSDAPRPKRGSDVDPFNRRTVLINVLPDARHKPSSLKRHARRRKDSKESGAFLELPGGPKYRVGHVVATGGMGVVHEAEDIQCRRLVAMKVLPKDEKMPEDETARFVEEARITAQLEHPNIIPVHELGYDIGKNVFYTMKYVKGKTLTEILMAIRRGEERAVDEYPLSRLLTIFQKACDAVAFAHSRGILHCDLKPDNIMICDFGEVLVMDWGLARRVDARRRDLDMTPDRIRGVMKEAVASSVDGLPPSTQSLAVETAGTVTKTTTGRVMGTPGFMAPERVIDDREIDARSDVYSLGATLYSLLCLTAPVVGTDMREMLTRILRGDLVPPAAFNDPAELARYGRETHISHFPQCPDGKIPYALSEIAMRALATEPAERFQTVAELQEEVEAYQNGMIWQLVLDEDFKTPGFTSRWDVLGGQWEIVDGELRLREGEPQLLILKRDLPGDVRLEFECHIESVYLNDVSCFISAMRTAKKTEIPYSGYEFKFGGYDNSMNLLVRSDRRLWSQVASPLERGKTYHVRAERVGSRLRMTVNNEEIFRAIDPEPLSGGDRTVVGLFGWISDTRYSRIRVYTLGTPWKTDILDLAERQLQKGNYPIAAAMYEEAKESFPDPARRERAIRGYEMAVRCKELKARLPEFRRRLEAAWPDAKVSLGMDNDGLTLDIADAGIEDLEPLRGMPLRALYCQHNRIRSLEPLEGMALVTLNCAGNPVGSLEPLRGMPLTTLNCERCDVDGYDPLRGMALTLLIAGGNPTGGLEPLRGMPLTNLSVWGNDIEDLEPLRGMPLSVLYCNSNRIESLDPLHRMPLVMLNCAGNRIKDLLPLRGAQLKMLHCGQNRIADLAPLRGMTLTMLTCTGNRIENLEPVAGMPLGVLTCGNNRLTTLCGFIDDPPEDFLFDCDTLPDSDLEKARNAWRRHARLAHHVKDIDVILALRRGERNRLRAMARTSQGHRYLFVPKFFTWEKAMAFCEELGGHLVTISGMGEQGLVESLFVTGCWAWMGLRVTEQGNPEWVTGEPMTYLNFVDVLQQRKPGPKVFSIRWASEDVPGSENTFVLEWDS